MKAVILAGGLGTRLSEETTTRPKPMVEVGGWPMLWHICKIYSHHGVREFIICLGYRGYVIKEYFANYRLHMSDVTIELKSGQITVHRSDAEDWKISLIDTGNDTMTGGRIKRALSYLEGEDTFCATYGDGLADVDVSATIDFHRNHGKLATVTAVPPPGRFGNLEMLGDSVKSFHEKNEGDTSLINGGFFVLSKGIGDYVEGDTSVWEREPLERLAAAGELMAFKHGGFWQPMDTLRDKLLLERMWSEGRAPWKVW